MVRQRSLGGRDLSLDPSPAAADVPAAFRDPSVSLGKVARELISRIAAGAAPGKRAREVRRSLHAQVREELELRGQGLVTSNNSGKLVAQFVEMLLYGDEL